MANPNQITIYIRAIDKDSWIMAPDLEMNISLDTNIIELFKIIHESRPHISVHRIHILIANKLLPENKYNWTIRKLGIVEGTILVIEPTVLRAWAWETIATYTDKYLRQVADIINKTPDGRIDIEKLGELLPTPPVLPPVLVLLRKYPDKFFIRKDLLSSKSYVQIADIFRVPTYESIPIELGKIHQYVPKEYNWEDNQDVDSMRKIVQEFKISGRLLELNIVSARNVRRLEDVSAPINTSCVVYFDRDYDPEFEGTRFNPYKRSVVKIGETSIRYASNNPDWGTVDSMFNISLEADDDLELCQLIFVLMDHSKRPDEDAESFPIGLARLDGEDLAAFFGGITTSSEELTVYEMRGENPKECGKISFISPKSGKFYEFFVSNTTRVRVDTAVSGPTAQHYCVFYWNGEEYGKNLPVAEDLDSTWARKKPMVWSVQSYPYDRISECRMEIQLWASVHAGDVSTAKIAREFIGAAILEGNELEKFLCADPFYASRIEIALKMSLKVPKDQRANLFSGTMTLIGGRSGLLSCPEGYHILDATDTKQLVKLTSPSSGTAGTTTGDKNKLKIKAATTAAAATATTAAATAAVDDDVGVVDSSKDAENDNNELLDAAISQEEAALVAQFEAEARQKEEEEANAQAETIRSNLARTKYYEVRILKVEDVSYCSEENIVASAHIGSESLGFSAISPATSLQGIGAAVWDPKDEKNTFVFPLRIPGKDATYQPDPRECALKVSFFLVKKGNVLGRFLGCFNPKNNELYEVVNENSYSKVMDVKLSQDPERNVKVHGDLTIRIGSRGARQEQERMLVIDSVKNVKVKSGLDIRNKDIYCIVFWNKVEVGRTKMKRVDFNPINRFAELHNNNNNNNNSNNNNSSSSNGNANNNNNNNNNNYNYNNNNNNNNNLTAGEPNNNNPIEPDDKTTTAVSPTTTAATTAAAAAVPVAPNNLPTVQENEDNKTIATTSLDDPKTTTIKSISSYTGRSAVLLQRTIDVFWGADDFSNLIYFEQNPPEIPSKDGNIFEIELVVEVPLSSTSRSRTSVINRMSNLTTSGQPDSGGTKKKDGPMIISMGCLTITGNNIDKWFNSKDPVTQSCDLFPSYRYPMGVDGTVLGKISLLSQMSLGGGAPVTPVSLGTIKISNFGLNCISPYQIQKYYVNKVKAELEEKLLEEKKAAEKAAKKEKKKAEKIAAKKAEKRLSKIEK